MKYESDILETIHEQAITEFRLGLITEAEMREYDELCLPEEALQDNTTHETVNIEHAEPQPSAECEGSPLDLVTA